MTILLQLARILIVVVFQSYTGAVATDVRMDVAIPPSVQHVARVDLNKTRLSTRILTASKNAGATDERVFSFGTSFGTKLKSLTSSAANKLEKFVTNAKHDMSRKKQLATNKLFTKLNVDKVETNLLESAPFQIWFNSVTKAYRNKVGAGDLAMARTLTVHFSDRALTKLLIEAKTVPSTKIIAQKLEEGLLAKWLADGKSVDNVFTLLKIGETGENLFKNPLSSSWIKYTNIFEKNPEEVLFSTLKTHFDDEILAKMIITGKEESSIAAKLESVELEQWMSSGKTIDDVFKLLHLSDDKVNLLKNPIFNTWVSYVTKVDKESPYEIVLAKLLTRYDDQHLVNSIVAAKREHTMPSIAAKLEVTLLNAWFTKGKSSHDVFKLLSLNKIEGVDVLKNSALNMWISYVQMLKKNPEELLLKELKLRNSDRSMIQMLVLSQTDSRSKDTAERLKQLIQKNWIDEDKTADDVFKLLELRKEGDSVFNSPMWSTWGSFLEKLNKENPEGSMYLVLKKHFGEEKFQTMIGKAKENRRTKSIADKLQNEIWLSEGKTVDDIFKLLKLNEKEGKVFANPMLSIWISYVKKLEKFKEKPDEYAVISYLENQFGGAMNLARMLGAEKHMKTPDKVVTDLQLLQFKQWMTQMGMDPSRLDNLLMRDTSNMPINLRLIFDFHDFYKANGGIPIY